MGSTQPPPCRERQSAGPRHVLIWTSDSALAEAVTRALAPLANRGEAVVETAAVAEEIMAAVLDDRVDVLVADLGACAGRPVTALRNCKRVRPRLPVVVLASVFDETFSGQVLPLGIHCHHLREFEAEEMLQSVRSALRLPSTAQSL